MIINELKAVINREYGGFSFTQEISEWLEKNKGWKVGETEDCDIIQYGKDYFFPSNKDRVRTNPDLVECIETLQEKYKDTDYTERRKNHQLQQLFALRVKKVTVHLEVEDVHDGKEEISCWSSVD